MLYIILYRLMKNIWNTHKGKVSCGKKNWEPNRKRKYFIFTPTFFSTPSSVLGVFGQGEDLCGERKDGNLHRNLRNFFSVQVWEDKAFLVSFGESSNWSSPWGLGSWGLFTFFLFSWVGISELSLNWIETSSLGKFLKNWRNTVKFLRIMFFPSRKVRSTRTDCRILEAKK